MHQLLNYDHTSVRNTNGYVAIASVLVIAAVLFILSVSVSLLSVNEIQSSLSQSVSESTLHLIEGCSEDALLKINTTNALPVSLTYPEGTCTITTDSHVGNNWVFTITGTRNGYTKSVQVSATRTTTVTVTQWSAL